LEFDAAMHNLNSIRGQVAIVTGGTMGIGLACAERFAAEGAKVAIIGRNADNGESALESIKRLSEDAIFLQGDCTVGSQMQSAVSAVEEKWGRIDILVNCAGGFFDSPRIDEIDEDGWRKGIEWNLTSQFITVRLVVPIMKRNGYGRIVNMSSLAARGGIAHAPLDYSAAKAGVEGFTRRLAIELAPTGITANAIAPGTTQTPRFDRLRWSPSKMEQAIARIPVGRFGTVEEVAHGIWYLCTPGAGYVTGAVLDMNGGAWTGG
jgi:NAD(P)-dependent dehydrogenase (short-subunit alcohol dehydrogenase family)